MKREEKNQQTKHRILDGALSAFSAQGYGASSINALCSAQGISKGIVRQALAYGIKLRRSRTAVGNPSVILPKVGNMTAPFTQGSHVRVPATAR